VKSFASWRSLSASLNCVALPKCKLRWELQPTLVRGPSNQNYCVGVTYNVEGLELSYVSSSSPSSLVGIPARGGRHNSHQLDKSLHPSGSIVSLQKRNSEDTPLQEYRVSDGELLYISCPAARAPKSFDFGGKYKLTLHYPGLKFTIELNVKDSP